MDNPDPLRISGQTYQKLPMHEQRRQESGYDVEELALGMVRLAGGSTLDITEAWAMHLDGLEGAFLLGDQGGVRLEPFGWFHTHGDLAMDSTPDLKLHGFRQQFVHQVGDTWADPQSHWIAALQGHVELLPAAHIALNCMLISEGIYLSARRETRGKRRGSQGRVGLDRSFHLNSRPFQRRPGLRRQRQPWGHVCLVRA